jgi:hypothetical protein
VATLQSLKITPVIAKESGRSVMEITRWQDVALLLSLLAFGSFPLVKFTFDRLPEEKKTD